MKTKKPKISDLVDARLRALNFHPYPNRIVDLIVPRIEEKMSATVGDVLKDRRAIGLIASKLDPTPDEGINKAARDAAKTNIGKLTIERLKALSFYPVPDDLLVALVSKVGEKESEAVSEVLKDLKAVASFVSKMEVAEPTPPAAVPAKK